MVKSMFQLNKMNYVGLVAGGTILALIALSFVVPWWSLVVGDNLVEAKVSPVNTNFNFVGDSFTIPLIWALNIGSIISLAAGGVAMLFYSLKPAEPYSKRLLDFAYKKPLYSVVFFIIGLFATTFLVNSLFNFEVPLLGSITSVMPTDMTQGANVSIVMTAEFIWPFWVALISAALCIAAKFYHKKITTSPLDSTTEKTMNNIDDTE